VPVHLGAPTAKNAPYDRCRQPRRTLCPSGHHARLVLEHFCGSRHISRWQGLNPSGLHVALTNRRGATNDPARRSRGQLCIDALRLHSARAATDWLPIGYSTTSYTCATIPCNLLVSDGTQAFVIHYDGSDARPIPLTPGLHLLSETNINDPDHPRIKHARAALTPLPNNWTALKEKLQTLLADHNQDGAICLHGERGGTLSSALLALRERSLRSGQFHFADGPPCTAPYLDLSAELQNYTRDIAV
jgi:hypothetical protein